MPEVSLVPFAILGLAVLAGAIGTMTSRNIVHAAFWMLLSLLATAGLYMLLSAEFVALVQVLVYAGAVSVLVLFTIMLTLRRRTDALRPLDVSFVAAGLALALGGSLYAAMYAWDPVFAAPLDKVPTVEAFGRELFTRYALPFEIASLVLLVALVGAVWWAGGDDR